METIQDQARAEIGKVASFMPSPIKAYQNIAPWVSSTERKIQEITQQPQEAQVTSFSADEFTGDVNKIMEAKWFDYDKT